MRGYLKSFILCGSDTIMQDIPDASFFVHPKKRGTLLKLTGKGWLYSGSWKKRYCVLDGTKFYYYENEKSHGSDRTCGVLSLDYYDVCEEYETKDKKNSYVFIIGTSVRGFFDNRHQFAAETEAEMQDWIRSVHDVITEARNIRSRAGRARIGSDKISPVITGNRIQVISQMNEETNDQESSKDVDVTPLVNATKDRVRGPQGRRLPQRKSMMPPVTNILEDDDVFKPRSFSLSGGGDVGGTAEDEESEDSPGENRRISLSLEIVDQTDKSDDTSTGDNQQQRSSSSHDLPTQRPNLQPKLPKKPIFGRLGGQHSALTKELELKLKSGLAPGGHRFHEPHPEETSAVSESDKGLDRKVESLQSQVSSMQKTIEALQNKIESLEKSSVDNNNGPSSTDWTDVDKNEIREALNKANAMLTVDRSEIREILTQATAMLKAAEETNRKSEQALLHAMQTNQETAKLCREVQSSHGGITTIPDLMFDPKSLHS